MIAQGDGSGKKSLERGLLHGLRSGTLVTGVQVVVEKGAKVDLVEWVCGGGRFHGVGCGRFRTGGVNLDRPLERLRAQVGRNFAGNSVGVRGVAQGRFQELLVGWIADPLGLQQGQQFFRRNLFAGFLAGFFEHRVLDDFLGDHLL